MVQFALPKDSKVIEGKYFKDKTNGKNLKSKFIDGILRQNKIQD